MTTLEAGDVAPPFELLDQHGKPVRLADFRGRKLLVYFYPEADTPGCTTQSCSVRDHRKDLAGIGMDVVGISPDQPRSNWRSTRSNAWGSPCSRTRNPRSPAPWAPGEGRPAKAGATRAATRRAR